MPYHAGAPHIHSFLAIQLFQSAQDISKIRVSIPNSIQVISWLSPYSSHLIQPVQSLFQIFQRCFF